MEFRKIVYILADIGNRNTDGHRNFAFWQISDGYLEIISPEIGNYTHLNPILSLLVLGYLPLSSRLAPWLPQPPSQPTLTNCHKALPQVPQIRWYIWERLKHLQKCESWKDTHTYMILIYNKKECSCIFVSFDCDPVSDFYREKYTKIQFRDVWKDLECKIFVSTQPWWAQLFL